ncbi:50S ribosomal protein L3 [Thermodesulfitimonas autotrophica]|uniref:50S ribosomal protein L3 n=1 Tax=Thermodesulfitimonas autotrophica TaxID=1894989 RepID=UPI002FE0A460
MMKGILGRKLGMTQYYTPAGEAVAVTVIEAGPCVVVQTKTKENDGYEAVQVGFGAKPERLVNKPLKGHFARAGVKPLRYLREFRVENAGAYAVGQEIKVDIFSPGERVDITGTSKGRGFAGGIKRHGFHRGPMGHGSKYHRRPGALAAKGPARVFKGRRLPGHYGNERVTVQNLEVVKVDPERNILMVRGAVPGNRGGLLIIKEAVKQKR